METPGSPRAGFPGDSLDLVCSGGSGFFVVIRPGHGSKQTVIWTQSGEGRDFNDTHSPLREKDVYLCTEASWLER